MKKGDTGKKIGTGIAVLALVAIVALTTYARRSPTLEIIAPIDGMSVQAPNIAVSGNVSPTGAVVTVNGQAVSRNGRTFSYNLPLIDEKTAVTVVAENGGKSVTRTIALTRIFTTQEKADMASAEAKATADRTAYDKSPAGKLCKTLAAWGVMNARANTGATRDDCERAARGDVWIGMNVLMLIAERGQPDVDNQSNYGRGNEYQYCWYDLKPECVYLQPGSDLITSYN